MTLTSASRRLPLLLARTMKPTRPLPWRGPSVVSRSHGSVLSAVHAHGVWVSTSQKKRPPSAGTVCSPGGDTSNVHAGGAGGGVPTGEGEGLGPGEGPEPPPPPDASATPPAASAAPPRIRYGAPRGRAR